MNEARSKKSRRKIDNLIVIFAGLVVFVTFVVKEGLREQYKGLVDSIDSAQEFFLIRSGELRTAQMIEQLDEHVKAVENALSRTGTRKSESAEPLQRVDIGSGCQPTKSLT